MIAVGFDANFRHFGWAVVRLDEEHEQLVALGVIRTKKGKGKVLVRDDDRRCFAEIARELLAITKQWRPDVVCAEALNMMPPRPGMNIPSRSTSTSGRAWGLVDMLCEVYGVALLQAAPQTIKKVATGNAGASKDEVIAALDRRFNGAVMRQLSTIRATTMWEHPADALGAIVALLDNEHMRLARSVRRPIQGTTTGQQTLGGAIGS